jgi:hypothetical protein
VEAIINRAKTKRTLFAFIFFFPQLTEKDNGVHRAP